MELASGFSDTYNPFPGGYSPAQNAAFNATMSNAAANQAAVSQASQNFDPFASGGGFGRQTDYYSSLGAAYGRGTGGFNASPGTPQSDPIQGPITGGDPAFSNPAFSEPVYGRPDAGYTPATQGQVDSFGPQAQSYADQHHARYGYYPSNDYFSQHYEPFNSYGQPGVGGSGMGDPFATQPATPAPGSAPSWSTLTPEQGNYVTQHIARYGTEPASDFFVPGGGWDQNYGPQSRSAGTTPSGSGGADFGSRFDASEPGSSFAGRFDASAPGASFDDRYGAAPSIDPRLQPTAPPLPNVIMDGGYPGGGFSVPPANPEPRPPDDWSTLTPDKANYVMQHIQRYGYEPASDFFVPGGGWDQNYGPNAGSRDSIASTIMASGSDPSYLGAGGPNNDYNPFGKINSGQIGSNDAFMGFQPDASFNDRFGNIPGQPYRQGYFDNTFGAVNAQPQAYNPTYGGGYPGPMASDGEAQRRQLIQDLYKTLGIIDNAGETGRYMDRPYGDTLQQGDVFTSPGGG